MVLLNDARAAYQASDLARQWAGTHDALSVGLTVLDVECLCGEEPAQMAGMSAKEEHAQKILEDARSRLAQARDHFQSLCTQSNVTSLMLDEQGQPADVIAREAQRFDLVLVDCPQSRPILGGLSTDQLTSLVKLLPRPLVIVPQQAPTATDVVIAYDGSLPAARAVQAFVQLGLAADRQVHVVGIAEHFVTAARRVDRAIDFLGHHQIAAKAIPIASEDDPAAVLLDHLNLYPTGLLVMGTFGQNFLREAIFGSVTKRLLTHCPVPILLSH
jgi:nucleotide-binding universal stress UspA family protein